MGIGTSITNCSEHPPQTNLNIWFYFASLCQLFAAFSENSKDPQINQADRYLKEMSPSLYRTEGLAFPAHASSRALHYSRMQVTARGTSIPSLAFAE